MIKKVFKPWQLGQLMKYVDSFDESAYKITTVQHADNSIAVQVGVKLSVPKKLKKSLNIETTKRFFETTIDSEETTRYHVPISDRKIPVIKEKREKTARKRKKLPGKAGKIDQKIIVGLRGKRKIKKVRGHVARNDARGNIYHQKIRVFPLQSKEEREKTHAAPTVKPKFVGLTEDEYRRLQR